LLEPALFVCRDFHEPPRLAPPVSSVLPRPLGFPDRLLVVPGAARCDSSVAGHSQVVSRLRLVPPTAQPCAAARGELIDLGGPFKRIRRHVDLHLLRRSVCASTPVGIPYNPICESDCTTKWRNDYYFSCLCSCMIGRHDRSRARAGPVRKCRTAARAAAASPSPANCYRKMNAPRPAPSWRGRVCMRSVALRHVGIVDASSSGVSAARLRGPIRHA